MKNLILFIALGLGLNMSAQNTCLPPNYFFNNKTRISGNGGLGSQYRFNNVLPGINAFITITKIQNASIDSNTIDNSSSYPLAWQPFITFPSRRTLAGDSSYMEFNVEFKTNASTPVLLPQECMAMTVVDCDGNGNNSYREFAKVSLPAKPMGVLNSSLSVFQDETWVLFKSGTATFNNIDTNNKAAMGQVSFPSTGVSSYSMRVGVIGPVAANTQRQFSFYFKSFAGLVVTLPVELIDFKANKLGDHVDLSWISAKEENFSHFEVYRSSNGTQFEYLASVNSKSANSGISVYGFSDAKAFGQGIGSVYYRLKMVDADGAVAWSHLLYVGDAEDAITAKIGLYPNPVSGTLNVAVNDPDLCESILVKDVYGKTVLHSHSGNSFGGLQINVSELEPGVYVLVVYGFGGSMHTSNFVKQ
jgi:hypothetical protein